MTATLAKSDTIKKEDLISILSELPHACAVKLPGSQTKLARVNITNDEVEVRISAGVNSVRTVPTKYHYASQQYIPIAANPRGTQNRRYAFGCALGFIPLLKLMGFLYGFFNLKAYPLIPNAVKLQQIL